MGRRRKVKTCGHSASVRGAADLVALIESVPGVHRVTNGRINRIVRNDFRGVKIGCNPYCVQITLHADDGTQRFSVVPVSYDQLSSLHHRIAELIKRRYQIWEKRGEMVKNTKQEREAFLKKIYSALLEVSEEINGDRVVRDIRPYLKNKFGFSESKLNGIQSNRNLLVPVGNGRPAIYRLIAPNGYETVESGTISEQMVTGVTEQVSVPIPPEMLTPALEALYTQNGQEIDRLNRENTGLQAEAESLRARITQIESMLRINSEQINVLREQNDKVIVLLDRIR